jgi:hypothetical protein
MAWALAYLATGWLGEPEGPLVHQRVLNIEVILVMEDSYLVTVCCARGWLLVLIGVASIWGDRDGREVDRRRGFRIAIDRRLSSGGSHVGERTGYEER